MAYTPVIQAKQRQTLSNLLNQHKHCDIKFVIGENKTEFDANRVFLASISPVFTAMLYGNMKESKHNAEIEIPDIDADAFQCVLNHAYCNDPKLTPHNVIAVRHIADKYQISLLLELCDEYFLSCLNPQNICLFLSQAIGFKLDSYIIKCVDAIKSKLGTKAEEILKSTGFLTISFEAMKVLLGSDHLYIKEEDIWESVLKWTQHQISNQCDDFTGDSPASKKRKLNDHNKQQINLLKQLCPYIRFGLMDGTYFVKNVRSQHCLSDREIADIMCHIQCNDESCGVFLVQPRRPKEYLLKYILTMSSRHTGFKNTYSCLINERMRSPLDHAATQSTNTEEGSSITANFDGTVHVTRIQIGTIDNRSVCDLQYRSVSGNWEIFQQNIALGEITEYKLPKAICCNAVRLHHRRLLIIGCLKIYGF